jgi:hypothetical protein
MTLFLIYIIIITEVGYKENLEFQGGSISGGGSIIFTQSVFVCV